MRIPMNARLMLGVTALLALPSAATATTFTVTSSADAADATAGNGVCATAGGVCTLRAAIQETNALAAGAPHTIAFAIPVTDPGFTAGTGVFTIVPASVYPAISRTGTIVDGATQATSAAGNTNPGVLGTGGTVGVDALPLPQVQRPEILVRDNAALATGFSITASDVQIRGLGIHGFGTAATNGDIVVTGATTGVRIVGNVIGSTPTAFALPGVAAQQSAGNAVTINAPDNGFVQDNLIGFAAFHGVVARGGAAGWTVTGNETRNNGRTNNAAGGVAIEAAGTINSLVQGNLIAGNGGAGLDTAANTGPNTFRNNTISGNGVFNNATAETPGVRLQGSNNVVDRNVVSANYGAGIMVVSAAATNRITRNAISANGTIVNLGGTAATNQIGIDLLIAANSQTRGTAPYVSLNDAADADVGGNAVTNSPVLVTAERVGANVVVSGFARPGAIVELFVATPDPSGFGEGQTYLTSAVEGSGLDSDDTTGTYGPGAVNGIVQGTDTTNRFRFAIPVASLPAPVVAGTVLTATATVLSATSEFSGNVTVTAAAADLTVTLVDAPDPVVIGQTLTYTVTVTNAGPGVASTVATNHTLPPGVTFTGATPSQGACSQLLGTVSCALGNVTAGNNATVTVTVVPNTLGSVTSSVTATAAEVDPTTPNVANATTTVVSNADITVTVADAPDPVASGQQVTATITVTNQGPDAALDVVLSNVLSGNGTLISVTPSQGSCTTAAVCSLGTIPTLGTVTVTVVATAGALGTLTNTATATTASTDPDPATNTAAATTTIVAAADVALTMTDAPDPVGVGQTVTYTLVVTNNGPDPAFAVSIADPLPPTLTFVSVASSQGTCTPPVACAVGTLASGASAVITIAATATATGSVVNTATASTTSTDAIPANDTASTTTAVTAPVDLQISATATPTSVPVGQPTTTTLTVTNVSALTATGVVVTHVVPFGATLGAIVPGQGTCTQSASLVTCSLGSLAGGGQATIDLTLTPTVPGTLAVGATVAGDQGDPVLPNTATASVTVTPLPPDAPDLALVVNTSRAGVSLTGDLTALTAIVTNAGAGAATSTTVVMRVRGGTVVSTDTSAGTCTATRAGTLSTITCLVGRVAAGERATVAVIVQANRRGPIPAIATVTADQADPTPSDTTDVAATLPPPLGRLSVRIDAPRRVRRGQLMPYTVTVRNGGSQIARNVVVTVAPPAGSTPGAATIRTINGVSVGRAVTFALGDMNPGQTRIVSLLALAGQRLGNRRIAAAAITVDGVSGAHTARVFRVTGLAPVVPVTG